MPSKPSQSKASRGKASRSTASGTRAPDFYIVGQFKTGTTALRRMLASHPQIYMPDSEVWFHAPELRARAFTGGSDGRPDTLDDYLALFDDAAAEQRIGETTPSYLTSCGAARSIAKLRPDARIIAILREPAAFLRSYHLQCVQNRSEPEGDLRKALDLEPLRREGKAIPRHVGRRADLLYRDHVRYVEQLRRYYDVFPPEQILVLIYDDFRRDNEATLRRVFRFLDVDDAHPIEPIEANPTVRVRSTGMYEFLSSVYLARGGTGPRAIRRVVKPLVPKRLRPRTFRAINQHLVFGKPRTPDEETMRELRLRLEGEVQALSDYLGRDLVTQWGYGDRARGPRVPEATSMMVSTADDLRERIDRAVADRDGTRSGFLQESVSQELGSIDADAMRGAVERGRAALADAGSFESAELIGHVRDAGDRGR